MRGKNQRGHADTARCAASGGVGVTRQDLAMLAASAASDAALAGRVGAWAFTIVHGDVEDQSEQDVLQEIARLARSTGHLLTAYGTNDTTSYVFDDTGGRAAVLALQAEATVHGRFWWRTHTRFGGDA